MVQAKKIPLIWGEQNKAAPSLIPDILHGIKLWRKGKKPKPPQYLPTPVYNAFKKQTNIGWLQALMGLISHNCVEVQNSYLRSLGAKITGVRWISALIRKLWDTAWGICKFRDHTFHATDGPKKTEILGLINTRLARQFNKGISGLLVRCHFLFKTNIHTLLSIPVRQQLSWISEVSSARQCSQRNPNSNTNLLDADQLILIRFNSSRLIPSLTIFDLSPTLRTVTGPDKSRSLFIEREDYPLL